MRHIHSIILLMIVGILGLSALLGIRDWAAAAPPLSLDGYRDEKLAEGHDESTNVNEINGGCYVCHGGYRTESLVRTHAKEKIGCVQCHGKSDPHQADESHTTPPDKMYGLGSIDTMCAKCHAQHDVPAKKVIERWKQRCPNRVDSKQIVCTDCHFEHRLPSRLVVWDKKTGKLLVQKKNEDTNHGNSK